MKKVLIALVAGLALVCMMTGPVRASLTTIGTATYGGSDYNLIWDDDNNDNSVIWLDYSNAPANWSNQNAWAAGLDGQLTYNIDAAYSVAWDDAAWRLPSTVDGPYVFGYDGTTTAGYNITTSEMGHLYYTELSNLGQYDTSGNSQSGYGLNNTGDFEHLLEFWYWSGTNMLIEPGFSQWAWFFDTSNGKQDAWGTVYDYGDVNHYALAVRSGQVSAVPVPGAIWLLGSGLIGLLGIRRRRKVMRV